MSTKFDARQTISRDELAHIFPNVTDKELDDILRSIDFELTDPLRMDASDPVDRTITIGSAVVSNTENSRKKSLPFVNGVLPTFTTGTVAFPATSGGTVTVTPGADPTLTVTSNHYIKALITLKSDGNLAVTFGTSDAVEATATVPVPASNEYPIGYVTLFNNAGTIDNITQSKIYQFTQDAAASAPASADDWIQYNFNGIVKRNYLDPVDSSPGAGQFLSRIKGRAKVEDFANNLKVIGGVERVIFDTLTLIPSEYDDVYRYNVFRIKQNDDRFRLVGSKGDWRLSTTSNGGPGTRLITTNTSISSSLYDYIEIVVYASKIVLLHEPSSVTAPVTVTVDSNSPYTLEIGSCIEATSGKGFEVFTMTEIDLTTEGLHTIRVAGNAGNTAFISIYGVDIINSLTQVKVLPGTILHGTAEASLVSSSSFDYKCTEITGTKGARVIPYLTSLGAVARAVTEVNATTQYGVASNHSNEELYARHNFRRFGRGFGPQTLSSSVVRRVATAEDGVTNLKFEARDLNLGLETDAFDVSVGGIIATFTFIGTGIDIEMYFGTGAGGNLEVYINNTLIETISAASAAKNRALLYKIASGLKYGTHTLHLVNSGLSGPGNNIGFMDFLLYRPKKPSIPVDAVELADYCVPADFSRNTTSSIYKTSEGVIRRGPDYNVKYVGSWTRTDWEAGADTNMTDGISVYTTANGSYFETFFFGTGLELRTVPSTGHSSNVTVLIDGTALNDANFPSVTVNTTAGTWNGTTGVYDINAATAGGTAFTIQGLTLGLHKIRFTNNTTSWFGNNGLDVITPVHAIIGSGLAAANDTIQDTRRFDLEVKNIDESVDFSKAKAWLHYRSVTGNQQILNSDNIAAVLIVGTGHWRVYFKTPFKSHKYATVLTGETNTSGAFILATRQSDNNLAESNYFIDVKQYTTGSSPVDGLGWSLVCFGELQGE